MKVEFTKSELDIITFLLLHGYSEGAPKGTEDVVISALAKCLEITPEKLIPQLPRTISIMQAQMAAWK